MNFKRYGYFFFKASIVFLIGIFFVWGRFSLSAEENQWSHWTDIAPEDIKTAGVEIPSFYAWQRVYKTTGKSRFKSIHVNEKGKIKELTDFKEPIDPFLKKGVQKPNSKYFNNLQANEALTSPSEKYEISFLSENAGTNRDPETKKYLLVSPDEGEDKKILIPDDGGESFPMDWHPSKDIYFFFVTTGCTTDRSYNLWEYDVEENVFLNIGLTNGRIFPSLDWKWIIWETGRSIEKVGKKGVWITNLMAFDVEKNKNYFITQGTAINLFNRWAKL